MLLLFSVQAQNKEQNWLYVTESSWTLKTTLKYSLVWSLGTLDAVGNETIWLLLLSQTSSKQLKFTLLNLEHSNVAQICLCHWSKVLSINVVPSITLQPGKNTCQQSKILSNQPATKTCLPCFASFLKFTSLCKWGAMGDKTYSPQPIATILCLCQALNPVCMKTVNDWIYAHSKHTCLTGKRDGGNIDWLACISRCDCPAVSMLDGRAGIGFPACSPAAGCLSNTVKLRKVLPSPAGVQLWQARTHEQTHTHTQTKPWLTIRCSYGDKGTRPKQNVKLTLFTDKNYSCCTDVLRYMTYCC